MRAVPQGEKMASMRRAIVVVLDSVGVGALPDAGDYGDKGANTLANTARAVGGLSLPNLGALGLGNIISVEGVPPSRSPRACLGKMREVSAGKDTIIGHWELMGVISPKPFPTYPRGFPKGIIETLQRRIGRRVLGNKPASGTQIINELGVEHLRTGYPIVYTSADSVLQIAAHEEVISVHELYHICATARELLKGKHRVARVIARPFVGRPGDFRRTARRRDFSVAPPSRTVLDYVEEAGLGVWAVGKIGEIFAMRGISESIHGEGNMDCLDHTVKLIRKAGPGVILVNLVDFDMLWGHRNNVEAYAQGLVEVDGRIPQLIGHMKPSDLLIITADHGCDPTMPGTDHSREYVPLLAYSKRLVRGAKLGVRKSFADVGKTVADHLGVACKTQASSFLRTMGLSGRE